MIERIYVSLAWEWERLQERPARWSSAPRKTRAPQVDAFVNKWNTTHAPPVWKDEERIVFDKARHWNKYLLFKEFILEKGRGIVKISYQWADRKFSEEELKASPLLDASVTGANPLDVVRRLYQYHQPPCSKCGFKGERTQIAPLQVDRRLRGRDVNWTHAAARGEVGKEVVVSANLKNLMEENSITGVEFGPVYVGGEQVLLEVEDVVEEAGQTVVEVSPLVVGTRKVRLDEGSFQLKPTMPIEPLQVPPTRATWEDQCPQCKRFKTAGPWYRDEDGIRWDSLLYFPQSAWNGADVVYYDWNSWGYERSLIISQRLYRLLIEHRIRGFWCEPVYLI